MFYNITLNMVKYAPKVKKKYAITKNEKLLFISNFSTNKFD